MWIDQEAEKNQIDKREKNGWQVGKVHLEGHSKEQAQCE